MNDRGIPNGIWFNHLYPRNLGYIGFQVSYPRKRRPDVSVAHNMPPIQDSRFRGNDIKTDRPRLRGNDKVHCHHRVNGLTAHAGLTYRNDNVQSHPRESGDLKTCHHYVPPLRDSRFRGNDKV